MTLYTFGNIHSEELRTGKEILPLDGGKIISEVKNAYDNGESIVLVADKGSDLRKVIFQLGLPKTAKPLVIISGYSSQVLGSALRTIGEDGLTTADVQLVIGIAKNIDETKDFYVTVQDNKMVGINSHYELDRLLEKARRFVGIGNGTCQNMFVIGQKEEL
ncbi:hypothetical protein [Bacillus thuringiensis]|uniref:hypothetical protein n=1 Tax=Bacillus thuringiensis TaxID=1428 RepID=UPI000BFB2667|nr:hypothetical protein [Bacillus thuringiensis]PGT90098.1 hypothetical protein COD17_10130 [Bacillus thuringiensis]